MHAVKQHIIVVITNNAIKTVYNVTCLENPVMAFLAIVVVIEFLCVVLGVLVTFSISSDSVNLLFLTLIN